MRHATLDDLQPIAPTLAVLRAIECLTERGPGRFYRRGTAMLHFHVDNGCLFEDLKCDGEWVRYRLCARREMDRLVAATHRALRPKSA